MESCVHSSIQITLLNSLNVNIFNIAHHPYKDVELARAHANSYFDLFEKHRRRNGFPATLT